LWETESVQQCTVWGLWGFLEACGGQWK
jgi:hypothetical protein